MTPEDFDESKMIDEILLTNAHNFHKDLNDENDSDLSSNLDDWIMCK